MSNAARYVDQILLIVLPYVVFFTFFLMTIQRYVRRSFTYSSLSSQFLENQQHFWGLVPFHYGILVVLGGHFIAFLVPREILWWNSRPLRLYLLEATALVFALLTIVGLVAAIVRRITVSKVRRTTTAVDWILYALLLVQVSTGILVALHYPWGSSWFAASLSPYLWSLLKLNPDISFVQGVPALVKVHIVGAWALIGLFPFTRLVHILVIPNPYLWRKPQVVRWYASPQRSR